MQVVSLSIIFTVLVAAGGYVYFWSTSTTLDAPYFSFSEDPTIAAIESVIAANYYDIQYIRTRNYAIYSSLVIYLALVMIYLIVRVAFRPVRETLTSQKRFISNVAHELRTPIATLKIQAEAFLLEPNTTPAVRALLDANIVELNRLSDVINNLLSIDPPLNAPGVTFTRVNLARVAQTVINNIHLLYEKKHVNISFKKEGLVFVWGNQSALDQIIANVLKNAITHSHPYSQISVVVHPTSFDMVELCIEDHGVGIPREELPRVFEPFYRTDTSRTRTNASGGAGLGLAIVNELVKLHRGRIHIRSTVGKGTTVIIHFPIAALQEITLSPRLSPRPNEVIVDYASAQIKRLFFG